MINEKQNPKKNNIFTGAAIPTKSDIHLINLGKQSKTNVPTPTINHAKAYLNSNLFFRIILTIILNAIITIIAIIT